MEKQPTLKESFVISLNRNLTSFYKKNIPGTILVMILLYVTRGGMEVLINTYKDIFLVRAVFVLWIAVFLACIVGCALFTGCLIGKVLAGTWYTYSQRPSGSPVNRVKGWLDKDGI